MNNSLSLGSIVTLVAVTLGAGCSSAGAPSSASAAQDLTADAPTSAVDVLRRGGTFMFALEESDPAAYFHAECAKAGAAQADACYAAVADEARHEGVRFSTDATGQTVWTSFVHKQGAETICLQIPVALSAQGNTTVVAVPTGPVVGTQAHGTIRQLHFEVVDANTIFTNDPDKGKLVFHRAES